MAAEYIPGAFSYPPFLANWGTAIGSLCERPNAPHHTAATAPPRRVRSPPGTVSGRDCTATPGGDHEVTSTSSRKPATSSHGARGTRRARKPRWRRALPSIVMPPSCVNKAAIGCGRDRRSGTPKPTQRGSASAPTVLCRDPSSCLFSESQGPALRPTLIAHVECAHRLCERASNNEDHDAIHSAE